MKKYIFLMLVCAVISNFIIAQNINYGNINKADVQRMNFEIIGKVANNYLIYKEVKGKNRTSVYDENMQLLEEVPVLTLPKTEDLLDLSFYPHNNTVNIIYQYQAGNIVYLMGAKMEANGRILETAQVLDTTRLSYKADSKIYNSITSEDRSKIMAFKINRKDRSLYNFSAKLYNAELVLINSERFEVPMEDARYRLGGYTLANDGSLVFTKYNRLNSGNIAEAYLIEKPTASVDYKSYPIGVTIGLNNFFLDDIKIKIDENNGRYLLTSFFSEQKKGNINGLYVGAFNKTTGKREFEKTTLFGDELRKRAKNNSSIKSAFNDYFINNIIVHNDASFTIAAEALYSSNAGGWDRWGYWGPSFYSPWYGGWGGWGGYWSPYYYYSPLMYRSYWWGGWGPWGGYSYDRGWSKFNADNIAILSFDADGNKAWDNVIIKHQSEVETDGTISYQILNEGDGMHFLINNSAKISSLEDVTINRTGLMQENNPVNAKEKNIDFMPRYGKQVGQGVMIVPYSYKRNIGFAKIQL